MKPGEHPEFFRFPAPEGRSRESTITLDAEGRFFHDGERVVHPKLEAAMHTWISRHPDDHRYILTNGYDWTYFTVADAPFFVREIRREPERVVLVLSDATEEDWDPTVTHMTKDDSLVTQVKTAVAQGPFEAKFSRFAQTSLMDVLEEKSGKYFAKLGDRSVPLGGQ